MDKFSLPEIQRTNLSGLILTLKKLNVENFVDFDFIDAPNYLRLVGAINNLYYLGLINQQGELTVLGKLANEFPLEPE